MTAKEKAAERHLQTRYNLSLADRKRMLEYQEGKCAICGKPSEHFKKGLHVDHDHSTKLVRGLLCFACNSLIPNRKCLTSLLRMVLDYLYDPPAVKALGFPIYANKIKRKKRSKK